MEIYKCSKCGMSVNATCGRCDAPLVNDVLKLDDWREVQISKCPNGHGKIKSPLCCGEDTSCAIYVPLKKIGEENCSILFYAEPIVGVDYVPSHILL